MLSGEFQKGMNKMPYYYYWDWTYLLIIPGLILGLIVQAKVKSAYAQCSRIPAKCGLTASQMVADLLRRAAELLRKSLFVSHCVLQIHQFLACHNCIASLKTAFPLL